MANSVVVSSLNFCLQPLKLQYDTVMKVAVPRRLYGSRAMVSVYLDPPVLEALVELSARTRVPQAEYLREAVADLLNKYKVRIAKPKSTKGDK